MGILEDLKKEADTSRIAREQAKLGQAELERIYQAGIRPAMLRIHSYLLELVEQLGLVDLPVTVGFDFPGIGRINSLAQTNYRVSIDSHREPRFIKLLFECTAPEERRYNVMPKSAGDEACQFLTSQKTLFSDWAIRDANQEVVGLTIQCKLRFWVSLTFMVDIPSEGIRVSSYNFEGRGEKSFLASYQSIDEHWLDKLGLYVLRKNDSFGRLHISEEQRNRLRKLVEEGKKHHEHHEHRSIDHQQTQNAQEGLLLKLRNMFAKPRA